MRSAYEISRCVEKGKALSALKRTSLAQELDLRQKTLEYSLQ
jgi:hypothetical protein